MQNIEEADLKATNGVVHIVGDVILPDLNALLFGLEDLLNAPDAENVRLDEGKAELEPIRMIASPNPGALEVSIVTNGNKDQHMVVNVMNSQGLSTRMQNFDIQEDREEIIIDLSAFPRGVYIVHAQIGQLEKYIRVVR